MVWKAECLHRIVRRKEGRRREAASAIRPVGDPAEIGRLLEVHRRRAERGKFRGAAVGAGDAVQCREAGDGREKLDQRCMLRSVSLVKTRHVNDGPHGLEAVHSTAC